MDDTEGNSSMDSIRNGQSSPLPQVTPRLPQIPMMMRETPLSTKRERQAITPRFRRPAPKMIKTMPPTRSIWSVRKESVPLLVTPQGPKPLESPKYDHTNAQSFFEQVFQIDEIIGRGSFGEVFAARCREDSQLYAVKVSLAPIRQHSISKYREAESHMIIPPHKNLVKFYRAWEETGRLYIQTELCDQSLLKYCTEKHALPEDEIWNIFVDLLQAVHHLHSNDMIHDDIKPENIFLTKDMICNLGDFGLVINLKNPNDVKSAEEGDSKYLAPEVLNGRPTKSSDIFSLGMTILEATTDLDVPSNGDSWHQIRNGQIPDRFFAGISTDLRSLIALMLDSDPRIRPTSRDLLDHPVIKKKLMKRGTYVKCISILNGFFYAFSAVLVWVMAFFSVLFHPIVRFHAAIKDRQSEICAQFVNNQQHTPIQTPETSKVYLESLTGVAVRQASQIVSPFDFSDDENPPNAQRRLFTGAVPCRLNFDNDQDDDEEQATCSSSNSSAIEPQLDEPESPPRMNDVIDKLGKRGTPRSARRNLTFNRHRQVAASVAPKSSLNHYNHHTGSGDGFSNNSLIPISDQERTEKYLRMRLTEQQLDWADQNNVIDEAPPPMSCPPRIRRSIRDLPRMPVLNFNVLDEPSNKPTVDHHTILEQSESPRRRLNRGAKPVPRNRMMSFGSSGDEV